MANQPNDPRQAPGQPAPGAAQQAAQRGAQGVAGPGQGQAPQGDAAIREQLRSYGVHDDAVTKAQGMGLSLLKLIGLVQKYGPLVIQIIGELSADQGQPGQTQPGQKP